MQQHLLQVLNSSTKIKTGWGNAWANQRWRIVKGSNGNDIEDKGKIIFLAYKSPGIEITINKTKQVPLCGHASEF